MDNVVVVVEIKLNKVCGSSESFDMNCDPSVVDDCRSSSYLYSQLLNTLFI